jgi:hypothetical protein
MRAAWSSRTRSASRSRRCARCGWSRPGGSTWTLAEAVTPQCTGPDRVFGEDNAWGLGFGISGDGYGMGGLGGSYAGASTAGAYTVGFVTGSVGSHDRVDKLESALRECLGLPPGVLRQ